MPRQRHPDPDIERALRTAESSGWRIDVRHHGHVWGRMFCAHGHPHDQVSIWSTPRIGHDHAEALMRAIRRCQREVEQERSQN